MQIVSSSESDAACSMAWYRASLSCMVSPKRPGLDFDVLYHIHPAWRPPVVIAALSPLWLGAAPSHQFYCACRKVSTGVPFGDYSRVQFAAKLLITGL